MLSQRDLAHIWHPCSQMKDYETFPPITIDQAQGSYFYTDTGKPIIDAISSWWCKSLGHGHPRLKQALIDQTNRFEHVILANTTNDVIVQLSEKIGQLLPGLTKSMYASDGSCALEMALKMSLHTRQITGETQRNRFIALQNSYHGETTGALSVSDLGLYRKPYEQLLFTPDFITDLPYVSGQDDPLWHDCSTLWPQIEQQLMAYAHSATAIIVEPIVQGAGGILIYSADFLSRLSQFASQHGIHLIADEIMTGMGRTGKMLACEHAQITPDFLCLGKGLTAGWLPLSCMVTSDEIYQLFYDDYGQGKDFLHSHTFTGNALAASVALEAFAVLKEQQIVLRTQALQQTMRQMLNDIAEQTGRLTNIRGIGGVIAADLINPDNTPRLGYQIYQNAVELGAYLRPLGNTLYWFPPLNISTETMSMLTQITQKAIEATLVKL